MTIGKADVIRSIAGHDAGGLFIVLKTDGEFALLADGRRRRLENPKRKKLRHLRYDGAISCGTAEKLLSGEGVTNRELRRALAEYRAAPVGAEGGM